MWYDIRKTLSYNCLFNFIIGNRGGGKTYGFKHYAIRDFLRSGNEFVYVRRYKEELKDIKNFFDDVSKEFPNHTFAVKGSNFFIDDKKAGYAIVLSTAKIKKSVSYPNVNKICFDEFILDKGVYHYLPDEVVNFLELYETIARMRDVRVFFLSNALTQTNPYFLYFDISLPYQSTIKRDGEILIQLVEDADYIEAKSNTRFGKMIKGTSYGNYAIENSFLRDTPVFIEKRSQKSNYFFTFVYAAAEIGVWIDYNEGLIYVSNVVDKMCKAVYVVKTEDHRPNTLLLKSKNQSQLIKTFVENYKMGNVRYEDINLKNITTQIIKNLLY